MSPTGPASDLTRFLWTRPGGQVRVLRGFVGDDRPVVTRPEGTALIPPGVELPRFRHRSASALVYPSPDQSPRREYEPLADEPTLFRIFASLDPYDRAGFAAFATRYGGLGAWRSFLPRGEQGDPAAGGRPPRLQVCEPTADWARAIRRMREVVWVWDRYEAGDAGALAPCLGDAITRRRPGFAEYLFSTSGGRGYPGAGGLTDTDCWVAVDQADRSRPLPLLAAREYLVRTVNEALKGALGADLAVDPGGGFGMRFRPATLLAAMWYQFAAALVGHKRYRQCAHCGRWFEISADRDARTARRKYCGHQCRVRGFRLRIGGVSKADAARKAGRGRRPAAGGTSSPPPTSGR